MFVLWLSSSLKGFYVEIFKEKEVQLVLARIPHLSQMAAQVPDLLTAKPHLHSFLFQY